jgi:hypothetical protein
MAKQSSGLSSSDPRTNLFLASLHSDDLNALMQEAKIVSLKYRKRILRQDQQVDAVYFPSLACSLC